MGRACRTRLVGIEPASRAVAGSRYSGSREHVPVRREEGWGEGKCTGTRERTRCIRWSLGSANYGATRTGRCYYRLGPFVFGVYVHRRRRPRPRLCLLTNSATIALSQSLCGTMAMHPHCSRTLRNSLRSRAISLQSAVPRQESSKDC